MRGPVSQQRLLHVLLALVALAGLLLFVFMVDAVLVEIAEGLA